MEFELEPGEVVVRSVRVHVFVLVLRLLPFILLAFVPAILSHALGAFGSTSSQAAGAVASAHVSSNIARFFTGVWYLFVWLAAFTIYIRFFLTHWIITNLRIVDIKQYGFFNREVSSFMLTRVQDVTTHVSGLTGTLIGYGRLSVETAGQDDDFFMNGLANPESIRDTIMSQVAQLHSADVNSAGV